MKIQDLFEAKKNTIIGKEISGKIFTSEMSGKPWDGRFQCVSANLTTLEGSPSKISGKFDCYFNKLTSLKGGPTEVLGLYNCSYNKLKKLTGAATFVDGDFDCYRNELISLEGAPQIINGNFSASYNNLTSLKDIHKQIKKVGAEGILTFMVNPIKSHVLGVLLIEGCQHVNLENSNVGKIVNKYLPNTRGRAAIYDCQEELINAGFEEYAQL